MLFYLFDIYLWIVGAIIVIAYYCVIMPESTFRLFQFQLQLDLNGKVLTWSNRFRRISFSLQFQFFKVWKVSLKHLYMVVDFQVTVIKTVWSLIYLQNICKGRLWCYFDRLNDADHVTSRHFDRILQMRLAPRHLNTAQHCWAERAGLKTETCVREVKIIYILQWNIFNMKILSIFGRTYSEAGLYLWWGMVRGCQCQVLVSRVDTNNVVCCCCWATTNNNWSVNCFRLNRGHNGRVHGYINGGAAWWGWQETVCWRTATGDHHHDAAEAVTLVELWTENISTRIILGR